MNVLKEILKWSQSLSTWKRGALRHLVLHGELSNEDICSSMEICKSVRSLAEQQEIDPITKQHSLDRTVGTVPVSLVSIYYHRGVNALAEDQSLNFAPKLTSLWRQHEQDWIYANPQEYGQALETENKHASTHAIHILKPSLNRPSKYHHG